ncbi:13063_t:CDS:10 [Ambispora leptoticha]|uniref:Dolichyl-phosphate-mannose--protein mannosyltransferase n=1 Tax=Ambispora leptoticha TaxID=144679 RepID=A0A9N8V6S3_9GLOM|nr:13063_t:CDS:10 [Ambispora leptoticha]
MASNEYIERGVINSIPYSEQSTTSSLAFGDIRYRKSKHSHKDSQETLAYDSWEKNIRRPSHTVLGGLPLHDVRIIAGLVLLAFIVRLYRISEPTSVVFDEVHFGGFASKYIKGRFFMDVHPPLAKLLITLAAVIGGFDGNFDFKEIGKDYLEPKVPYVAMRLMPGILGILVIPISYLTIKLAGFSTISATLVAAILIFENGLVAQSRLILLDSPLILFTAFTVLMWVNFHNHYRRPFSFWWWFWMAMTGVGLGLTVSVKWVGLFTIALIGFSTIKGLWDLLGDLQISLELWIKHFLARALCLILIPIVIYMLMFAIHFAILKNSGDGDGFMSSEFQQTIGGHGIEDTPIDVAYGSKVTIKHLNTQGGYLHSHNHFYPGGSKQQQITLYPHQDENNVWIITNRTKPETSFEEQDPIWIENGAIIRLEHIATEKRLHSHDVRPPVTEVDYQNEVSGYGFPGFDGDDNDLWRVEIYEHDKSDPKAGERLRTLHTKFRLVHVLSGCYLFSHSVKLPEWGFEQQEVNYRKPGFFGKFFELQRVMWTTNAGLTDSHPYESRPFSWLLMKRGISFWGQDHLHIYLIGNPIVWWSSTAALLVFAVIKIFLLLRAKRGYLDHLNVTKEFYESHANFLFVGWFLHWVPFFLMSRQLFLHHYFPALYFSILLFGVSFDLFTIPLSTRKRAAVALIYLVMVLYVFRLFAPLTYGRPWIKNDCKKLKWISTWDFDCNQFYDSYNQFSIDESLKALKIPPTQESSSSTVLNSPESSEKSEVAETHALKKDGLENSNDALMDQTTSNELKVEYDREVDSKVEIEDGKSIEQHDHENNDNDHQPTRT